MFSAPGGTGRARPACLGLGLVSLLAVVAGCSGKPSSGSIQVLVELEPGLVSRCVKVVARDTADTAKETRAIPLAGKSSPLRIGMMEDGLVSPITVQAFGYSDEACTILTPGEESAAETASYGNPTTKVTLTLRPVSNGDGGTDGGADAGDDAGTDAGADAGTDAGMDAGTDAGVDGDGDGYPLPADCDDTNPNIHPGVAELCNNTIDDNCDSLTDCQDSICDGYTCANGGTCNGTTCMGTMEVCNDGVDNNGNLLVDCADPNCVVGTMCTDSNACTTGDQCAAGGVCQKTGDVMCSTPPAPQCYVGVGVCLSDGGPNCVYAMTDAGCDDTRACTINDSCANGMCSGTPKSCTQSADTCRATTGTCAEPSGNCAFAPLDAGTGTCNDGNNCTTGDTCDGDGGCTGTPVVCTPNQCQTASTGCTAGGACLFGNRNGQTCDAGTGGPATCDLSFNCNAGPATLFPFTPSNFAEADLPADAGVVLTVSSNRTLNTDTPSISVGTMPPYTVITPAGGQPTLLVRLASLNVNAAITLTVTGNRPVIFAVTGNATVDGIIRLNNPGTPTDCGNGGTGTDQGSGTAFGGGGGGGFGSAGGIGGASGGTAGAVGAQNGTANLIPLRGGCSGGNSTANGGAGGGVVQLSVAGTLTVNGTITAPGRAGLGAAASAGDSGGGGGSGGGILLEANAISLGALARLTANGGSGGEGSGGNSGNDGNDGHEFDANVAPNGGNNSNNGGNGGAGAAGTTAAQPGAGGASNGDGSGGGGGGVGRIRINGACSRSFPGAIISPAATPTNCP